MSRSKNSENKTKMTRMKKEGKCKRRDKGSGKRWSIVHASSSSFFRISKTCMYDKKRLPSIRAALISASHAARVTSSLITN
jgi:hypothetical protein